VNLNNTSDKKCFVFLEFTNVLVYEKRILTLFCILTLIIWHRPNTYLCTCTCM